MYHAPRPRGRGSRRSNRRSSRPRRDGRKVTDVPGDEPVLLTEDLGPVRRLMLNRPKALNAQIGRAHV